jgi:predicted Rossmann-fold nucleotide-binding protein
MSDTPSTNGTLQTPASGSKGGVAVYCGSHLGNHSAYQLAALSVGRAIAASGRPLVYGGGSKGIMGTVSGAALLDGGKIVAVAPYSILRKGGEGRKADLSHVHPEVKRALEVDRQHVRSRSSLPYEQHLLTRQCALLIPRLA